MTTARLVDRRSEATSFTCAEAVGIEKGALLKLTDPRTAVLNDTSGSVIAGICAREKIGGDGRTEVAVFTDGIFAMLVSGSVTIGLAVSAAGSSVDAVTNAPVTRKGRMIVGTALTTTSNNGTAQIELNPGGGGNQVS